jgi:hypothetical protein
VGILTALCDLLRTSNISSACVGVSNPVLSSALFSSDCLVQLPTSSLGACVAVSATVCVILETRADHHYLSIESN